MNLKRYKEKNCNIEHIIFKKQIELIYTAIRIQYLNYFEPIFIHSNIGIKMEWQYWLFTQEHADWLADDHIFQFVPMCMVL